MVANLPAIDMVSPIQPYLDPPLQAQTSLDSTVFHHGDGVAYNHLIPVLI